MFSCVFSLSHSFFVFFFCFLSFSCFVFLSSKRPVKTLSEEASSQSTVLSMKRRNRNKDKNARMDAKKMKFIVFISFWNECACSFTIKTSVHDKKRVKNQSRKNLFRSLLELLSKREKNLGRILFFPENVPENVWNFSFSDINRNFWYSIMCYI